MELKIIPMLRFFSCCGYLTLESLKTKQVREVREVLWGTETEVVAQKPQRANGCLMPQKNSCFLNTNSAVVPTTTAFPPGTPRDSAHGLIFCTTLWQTGARLRELEQRWERDFAEGRCRTLDLWCYPWKNFRPLQLWNRSGISEKF